MMNKDTSLSEWRTITEATLYQMMNNGVISQDKFSKCCDALIFTGISADKIYASEIEEVAEITENVTE